MKPVIVLNHVVKRFGEKEVIHDLSFDILPGSIVALLGPNGAGKTTAISMMLGLRKPTSGTIEVFQQNPRYASTREHVGAMLQQVILPQKVSVEELIHLFRSYYKYPLETHELLRISRLEQVAKIEAAKLSGGQQRRLQYALAMAGDPRILFLDEPTTGMDVTSRRGFWEHLCAFVREEGRTIILSTHHLEEADTIADRILVIQHGKIVADSSPEQLKQLTGNHYVSFVAGKNITKDTFSSLPGVNEIVFNGRHVRIQTTNSDIVLRALITGNYEVSEFEVSTGYLEDAFVTLTESYPLVQAKERSFI